MLMFNPCTVFLNEVDNDQATQAIETVKQYALKNPLGFTLNIMTVEGNRTDSKNFLEASTFRASW